MKKVSKFAFALLLSVTAGSLITSTVAWFKFGTDVSFGGNADDKVKVNAGISNGYFGGGDGSSEHPYIISNKTHLYNLAWLQYLGYFDGSSEPKQSLQPYFIVTNDINMNGITLPPIGTEEYPFLGNFNGGGHSIQNLTVSNNYADFGTAKPTAISSASAFDAPEIVGFFGTVGKLPNQDITYSSSVVSMTNFTLENISVNSETSKTLIGLAAGYVNLDVETISETETGVEGNMSGVKVSGTSSINVDGQTAVDATNITSNLSDYGLVGFTTKKEFGGDFTQKITEYYDSTLDPVGDDNQWGGSIDMSSLFTRLNYFKSNATSDNYNFMTTRKLIDRNDDGDYEDTNEDTIYPEDREGYPGTLDFLRASYNTGTGANADYRGNYNFTDTNNKIYMVGGTYQTDEVFVPSTGYHLTDGTHYLNSGLTNSNNGNDNNTRWQIDTTTRKIACYDEPNRQWIYLHAGAEANHQRALESTTNSNNATTWTITRQGGNLSIQYGNYRLSYIEQAGGWGLYDTTYTAHSYTITNTAGNSYLPSNIINNNGYITTTGVAGATSAQLVFDTLQNNQQVTFHVNGQNTTYYLWGRCRNGTEYRMYATTTNNNPGNYSSPIYYYLNNNNEYLRTQNKVRTTNNSTTRYIYLYYNGTVWRPSENNNTQYDTNCAVKSTEVGGGIIYGDYYLNDTNAVDASDVSVDPTVEGKLTFKAEDTTYFPITAAPTANYSDTYGETTVTRSQYEPLGKNSGYFVAGITGYDYRNTDSNNKNLQGIRSITMAENGLAKVNQSFIYSNNNYANGTLQTVKTITNATNGNKTVVDVDPNNYVKYGSSSSRLEGVLQTNDGQVRGMHFLNHGGQGLISKSNIVRAKNIRLGNKDAQGNPIVSEYPNYDLPVFSVDFNLRDQGYINFFAGNYVSGDESTDSFFSLHKVIRKTGDPTTIDAIKEIAGIYKPSGWKKGDPYVYSYKNADGSIVNENGGSFSANGAELVFDTSWIGSNSSLLSSYKNYIFYFEIPVDEGEYALGTVANGGRGAYLLYLDIGANGKDVKDNIYSYSIITEKTESSYPIGVDFAVTNVTTDGGNSLCVFIEAGKVGEVSFAVDGANINVGGTKDTTATSSSISKQAYVNPAVTVGGDAPPQVVPLEVERTKTTYITVVSTDSSNQPVTRYFMIVDKVNENGIVVDANGNPVYTAAGKPVSATQPNPYIATSEFYIGTLVNGVVTYAETTYANVILLVETLSDKDVLDSLRTKQVLITLEKTAGKVPFDTNLPLMPWTPVTPGGNADPYFVYTITISADGSVTIKITYTNGTQVTISGGNISSGGTYTYNP